VKVARWGNSLAVRLPQELAEVLSLREGDEIMLNPVGDKAFEVVRDPRREAAMERIRSLSRPFPVGFRFDRDEMYDTARGGSGSDRGEE
jgi:antitoxin MazE